MERSALIRVIKVVTLLLGAAILATLAMIGYKVFYTKTPTSDLPSDNAVAPAMVPAPVAPLADFSEIPLDQPAGSSIAGVVAQGDRLIVTVTGGGSADRIVVVDLARRRIVGSVPVDAGRPPAPAR